MQFVHLTKEGAAVLVLGHFPQATDFAPNFCGLTGGPEIGPLKAMRDLRRLDLTLNHATASQGWWWRSPERWRARG